MTLSKSKICSLLLVTSIISSCSHVEPKFSSYSPKTKRYTASVEEFVPQSLAEIMATHKEELMSKGATVATLHTAEAIIANHIPQEEVKEFLKQELSPKDFAKVTKALDKGISAPSEVSSLAMNIGNGANFRGNSCYSMINQAALWGGSIAAVAFGYSYYQNIQEIDGKKNDNLLYIQANESGILSLQNQITALKNEGVAPTSYLITTREADIARGRLAIEQSKVTTANDVAELDRKKKSNMTFAAIGAAAAGVSYLTCDFL